MSLFFFATGNQAQDEGQKESYVSEARLPKGWPVPSAYNEVVLKSYPAYRAAVTEGKSSSFTFWRLFQHIKKNDIPMTAPVEMGMKNVEGKGLQKYSMAFLYQDQEVGKLGADGAKIEVKDMPAIKTLCYTWKGKDSKANIEKARVALMKELKTRKLEHSSMRLLGYNGPSVPEKDKTWELQLVLK